MEQIKCWGSYFSFCNIFYFGENKIQPIAKLNAIIRFPGKMTAKGDQNYKCQEAYSDRAWNIEKKQGLFLLFRQGNIQPEYP